MNRKKYQSKKEERIDQLLGLGIFFMLLLFTAFVIYMTSKVPAYDNLRDTRILPWLINGVFLILAFIFRPQMAVGYLAGFCLIVGGLIILAGAFLASCVVAIYALSLVNLFNPS